MQPLAALVLSASLSAPLVALADASLTEASLSPGWAEADGARQAGLRIALAPGWKTYWRAPGEAGIPPTFDWSGSTNLASVDVEWPTPLVFDSFGMLTLGYEREVVLPLRLTAADPDSAIELRLGLDYGVCADICVPARADLALTIPPGAAAQDEGAIRAALAARPLSAESAGASAACALRGSGASRDFAGRIALADPLRAAPVVVVEGPAGSWFSTADSALDPTGLNIDVQASAHLEDSGLWIGRDALRLTMIGPGGAVEFDGCRAMGG